MTTENKMILYRGLKYQELFDDMNELLLGEGKANAFKCAAELIELAVTYGFKGNIYHCFLAFCLANHENAYSTSCEIVGPIEGTLNSLANHDMVIMRELYSCDIAKLDEGGDGIWQLMKNYENPSEDSRVFNKRIRDRIVELAKSLEDTADAQEFQGQVTQFYKEFGVGKFGLNKAFQVVAGENGENPTIEPITRVEHMSLDDLVGYEIQKQKLIENTEAFIEGRAANNCLLYGDSGTGKSSCIKSILNQYYDQGLRMIEVYKHQFKALSSVLGQIKDRNYKFIIYMDDLSFEEYEIEYKYLKAIIEGGLGIKPSNVLIYATSNRRHLIREKFSDKKELLDDDLHANDTVQEKLSLAARFGVTIYFGRPNKKQFQNIISVLAERYNLKISQEELLAEANKWELSHGGLSGRTAQQFITNLMSKNKK